MENENKLVETPVFCYDLIGKKFGKLIISKFLYRKEKKYANKEKIHYLYFYECLCECGKISIISRNRLLNKRSPKSCGCGQHLKNHDNPKWKGIGELSRRHYSNIKYNAIKRNIFFDIDIQYLWNLFLKQNRKCPLTRIELKFDTDSITKDGNASLDRIDSSKGYTEGNVQWVHKDINYMKQEYSQEYFINMCRKVAENNIVVSPTCEMDH